MILQKAARALLGAFDLKTLGENPRAFGELVAPVVDVYDNYLTGEIRKVNIGVAIGGGSGLTSGSGEQTVPSGKVWRVLAVGGTQTFTGADGALVAAMAVSTSPPPFGFNTQVPIFAATMVGAPLLRWGGTVLPRPLLLPGGHTLDYWQGLSAGPANQATLQGWALVQEIVE